MTRSSNQPSPTVQDPRGPMTPSRLTTEVHVTALLRRAAEGDARAYDRVAAWAYKELERLASARLRRRYSGSPATLEPAALVNETFLKMLQQPREFENRRHLLAFAGTVMMRVLIDHQRQRHAQKRGGHALQVTLDELSSDRPEGVDLIDFQHALERLEALDARKGEVLKLRLLWGYEMTEIAEIMEVSLSTVERDWRFARTWMAEALATSRR